jgi:predicted ATP-dependent Lon-type protease
MASSLELSRNTHMITDIFSPFQLPYRYWNKILPAAKLHILIPSLSRLDLQLEWMLVPRYGICSNYMDKAPAFFLMKARSHNSHLPRTMDTGPHLHQRKLWALRWEF